MIRMEDTDSMLRPPWTPNSGMKLFGIHTEEVTLGQLLDNTSSPMRLVEKGAYMHSDMDEFRSPSRPSKRQKAPPSPATAMLLNAARAIEDGVSLNNGMGNSPPGGFENSPGYHQNIAMSPVSPARTPSRLLFSPRSEPRVMSTRGMGGSPSNAMMTSYSGMLSAENNHSQDVIGSIWKQSGIDRQKTAKSTARRPLLQQTPNLKATKTEKKRGKNKRKSSTTNNNNNNNTNNNITNVIKRESNSSNNINTTTNNNLNNNLNSINMNVNNNLNNTINTATAIPNMNSGLNMNFNANNNTTNNNTKLNVNNNNNNSNNFRRKSTSPTIVNNQKSKLCNTIGVVRIPPNRNFLSNTSPTMIPYNNNNNNNNSMMGPNDNDNMNSGLNSAGLANNMMMNPVPIGVNNMAGGNVKLVQSTPMYIQLDHSPSNSGPMNGVGHLNRSPSNINTSNLTSGAGGLLIPSSTPTSSPPSSIPLDDNDDKDDGSSSLSPRGTPSYKLKTPKLKHTHSEPRKDRKVYSTAGRPRVRGEYKCGKCGYYPKKARHDCDEEKSRQDAAAAMGSGNKMRSTSGTPPTSHMMAGMNHSHSSPTPMIAPMKLDLGTSPVLQHKDSMATPMMASPMMDSHMNPSPTHMSMMHSTMVRPRALPAPTMPLTNKPLIQSQSRPKLSPSMAVPHLHQQSPSASNNVYQDNHSHSDDN